MRRYRKIKDVFPVTICADRNAFLRIADLEESAGAALEKILQLASRGALCGTGPPGTRARPSRHPFQRAERLVANSRRSGTSARFPSNRRFMLSPLGKVLPKATQRYCPRLLICLSLK